MIYIQVLDRYWDPGKTLNISQDDKILFHKFIADEYKNLLVKAIDDQRYRNKWSSLTASYLNYKRSHGYSTNIWELTGELKKSIRVRRRGQVYTVGFSNKNHSNANLKLVELAKILEFGTFRTPPRPLFRLVYSYISSNINYFYNKYLSSRKRRR